jgi:hypothetical protein
MTDGRYSASHAITFTEKRWHERIVEFLRFLPRELPLAVAVSVSLWSFSAILKATTDSPPLDTDIAPPILAAAFATALIRAYTNYRSHVPEALLTESAVTQAIYRKQELGWNFGLTRQMLSERIARSEAALDRIDRGVEYVEPRILDAEEYIAWLRRRPAAFEKLVHAAATQCTSDLPKIIGATKTAGDLPRLKLEVDALARLYEHMREQELSCQAVIPPDAFERIHLLTRGWSAAIRTGIEQFLGVLDRLASVNRKALLAGTIELPSFNITFDPPAVVEEFSRALESFDVNLINDTSR